MAADNFRKVYTRTGDDGTTALLYGGRVNKDSIGPSAYGAVDEAVAALQRLRRTLTIRYVAEFVMMLALRHVNGGGASSFSCLCLHWYG